MSPQARPPSSEPSTLSLRTGTFAQLDRMAKELDVVKDAKEKVKEELSAKVQQLTIEKQQREKQLRELHKGMSGMPVSARVETRVGTKEV